MHLRQYLTNVDLYTQRCTERLIYIVRVLDTYIMVHQKTVDHLKMFIKHYVQTEED